MRKYIEYTIAGFITLILFGLLIYTVKSYSRNVDDVIKAMQKHHGLDWRKSDQIAEVAKLKEEISRLEKRLQELSSSIDSWTSQADHTIREKLPTEITGLAEAANLGGAERNVVVINKRNRSVRHIPIGSQIVVTNMRSAERYSVECTVEGTYETDKEDGRMLFQLNGSARRLIQFPEELGRVEVSVRLKDEPQWYTYKEICQAGL